MSLSKFKCHIHHRDPRFAARRSYLETLVNANPILMGLDAVLRNWRTMGTVGTRQFAACDSAVGGQGMLRCSCVGKCQTNKCSCFKAGRFCNSRCHAGSVNCCNDGVEEVAALADQPDPNN